MGYYFDVLLSLSRKLNANMLSWVQVLLAVALGLVLPAVLNYFLNGSKTKGNDAKKNGSSASTVDEFMRQGLNERDARFQLAVDFVAAQSDAKLSNEQRLTLYAFFKQANLGTCSTEKPPSAVDIAGRAKWESWSALGDMPKDSAKDQYVGVVQELFPPFDPTGANNARGPHPLADKIKEASRDADMGMAGVVSMPTVDLTAPEWQVHEDRFHFASTGDMSKVEAVLTRGGAVDATDDEGRTMLHWAVDRSQTAVVELLLKHKASANVQDADGMTPLHYAVNCEDEAMAQLLMEHGARPDIEDNDGETPLSCACSDELRSILRT